MVVAAEEEAAAGEGRPREGRRGRRRRGGPVLRRRLRSPLRLAAALLPSELPVKVGGVELQLPPVERRGEDRGPLLTDGCAPDAVSRACLMKRRGGGGSLEEKK